MWNANKFVKQYYFLFYYDLLLIYSATNCFEADRYRIVQKFDGRKFDEIDKWPANCQK